MTRWSLFRIALCGTITCIGAGIFLAENATHLPVSARIWQIDPSAEEMAITASDGALLRAACFRPKGDLRGAVIVLHGVGDRGYSMTGFARLMSEHGYLVLAPDSRGHGGSGGGMITYGLLERHDIAAWIRSLDAKFHPPAFYGYGASLGGGILIQSLDVVQPPFRAIIAECPFADFRTVAYDRLAGISAAPRALLAPLVEPAFVYTRLRYGINLYDASPEDVLRRSRTPTLLIHGTEDRNIPIEHSRRLHAANPAATELWEIPGAAHVAAWSTAGDAYERRVIEWFAKH